MSRMSARSDAYARSEESSSRRACVRFEVTAVSDERAEAEGTNVSSSSSGSRMDKGIELEG